MSIRHNSRLVAIVDDDESVQSALQHLIESDGLSTVSLGSGQQFGIEDCVKENRVFREWARAWPKRVIVEKAIRELRQPLNEELVQPVGRVQWLSDCPDLPQRCPGTDSAD